VSKAELSFNGLVGVMEAMLEAAKRFQEFEERYLANEESFQQMQQQFRQMQDNAAQLQSLAEERLAALSGLSVELKARQAHGDQALAEVRELVEAAKACQSRIEQAAASVEGRHQVEADRNGQLAQTLAVVQALVEKLQNRQAQIEQSLLAVESLVKDQAKKKDDNGGAEQREARVEKALATLEAAQEVEKGLLAHFEKTLGVLKARVNELEKRPAGNGTAEAPAAAVSELMAKVEEVRQSLQGAVAGTPQSDEEFRKFLARCEEAHKAALEREEKLTAQWRKTIDSLPGRAEAAIQRFLDQNQSRLDQTLQTWVQQREQRAAELEKREDSLVNKVIERQRHLEGEVAKLASGGGPAPVSTEWMQAVEAVNASQANELRFLRTLLWVTLAAVGLSYGLVAYAVILRSS
jgi:chromosome segregation ATPase